MVRNNDIFTFSSSISSSTYKKYETLNQQCQLRGKVLLLFLATQNWRDRLWLGIPATEGGFSLFFLKKEHHFFPCDFFLSFGRLVKKGGTRTCSTSGSNGRCSDVPLVLSAWVGQRKWRIQNISILCIVMLW